MFEYIETGDPALFEQALRGYHDRVVASGGILIQTILNMKDLGKPRGDVSEQCPTKDRNKP
ncbi:MAG TPA: hypothetical protein VMV57_11700 [Terracidiphilus sp.]|nr:hypothetical protein [Terracidiphilus sp.]